MRLLNVASFQLEEFSGQVPPYAILSHTWENEEVTFAEIATLEKAQSKYGWKKIEYTCREAAREDLQYVWVDTCCINKSSSAELSEAINSMFQWYREAVICYIYLADVTKSTFYETIHSSRWFTRGWTLQELLAPTEAQFFDQSWSILGSRVALADLLSSITNIDVKVLQDCSRIQRCSVACRMSGASSRQTTRTEDLAYSLLGIFGVNMPLLYGEGNRAFLRLQQEILKVSDDHSIFAWGFQPSFNNLYEVDEYSCNRSRIGPLADCPLAFNNSGCISPIADVSYEPCVMTNRGLQITLPIARVGYFSLGLLACRIEGQEWYCIVIRLEPFHVDRSTLGYYARYMERNFAFSAQLVQFDIIAHATTEKIHIMALDSGGPINKIEGPMPPVRRASHDNVSISQTKAFKEMIAGPVLVLSSTRYWNSTSFNLSSFESDWVVLLFFVQETTDIVSIFLKSVRNFPVKIGLLKINAPRSPINIGDKEEWGQWARSHNLEDQDTYKWETHESSLILGQLPGKKVISAKIRDCSIYHHDFRRLTLDIIDSTK